MKKNLIFSVPKTPGEKFLLCLFSTLHKQALLGVLFCLSSLFVFTVPAAWTALFSVCRRLYDGEEVKTVRDYFSAFKERAKNLLLLSVVFVLLFAAGVYSVKTYLSLLTPAAILGAAVCVSFLLLFLLILLFLPQYLLFKSERPFLEAFALSFLRCVLCLFAVGLICGGLFLLLPFSAPALFSLAFPLACLCCVFIFDCEKTKRKGKE